jgi:C4-dicarboxylate-specific signal transduction histidine kinase
MDGKYNGWESDTAAQIRAAFDSLPFLVAILDREGTIVGTNASWERAASHHPTTGLGIGTNYLDVCIRAAAVDEAYAARAFAGIRSVLSGAAAAFAMEYRCEGLRDLWSEMHVLAVASPANGVIVTHSDITHHKQRRASTRASAAADQGGAPLQSVAELSAAITHELTQSLTAIRTNAEAARRCSDQAGSPGLVRDALADIIRDVMRASETLDAIKALYQRQGSTGPVDLNELINEVARDVSIGRSAANVRLRLDLDRSLPPLHASAGQLRQVLRNVLTNAVDATVGNQRDGLVTISTSADPNADAVVVHVVDNGSGVRDDVRAHVFEPFFSTKRDGFGVGLALAHAIVREQGGTIGIHNVENAGARVEIKLPVTPH